MNNVEYLILLQVVADLVVQWTLKKPPILDNTQVLPKIDKMIIIDRVRIHQLN